MCSKKADETTLNSKLPVADRIRGVWGRKLCWWCLSSGFPLSTFLFGFAESLCFVFTSTPSYEASPLCSILCNLFPWLDMLKSLKEALRVSLYASSDHHGSVFRRRIFFGKRSSGVLLTWPVHLNCANFRRVCTLCIPALFRTSVSGILACHLTFRSF